jgi:hypothetical protein
MIKNISNKKRLSRRTKTSKSLVTKEQVKSMLASRDRPLIKYIDTIIDLTGNASTNSFTNLNLPTSGVGVNNRVGLGIKIDSFEIHYTIYFEDAVTTSADVGFDRVLLFQNVGEGLINAPADLLDDNTTPLNTINSPLSYSNKGKLFSIVSDKLYHMDTFNPTACGVFHLKPKVHNLAYNAVDSVWSTGAPTLAICRFTGGITGGSVYKNEVLVRTWFYDV